MRESTPQLVDENQIQEISGRKEEESAILELIGDIAGYRPGGKVVVFEGEDSEFDKRMTAKLFPTYDKKMNFVSGGNKRTVRRLHEVLDMQSGRQRMTFSIVDKDDTSHEEADEERGMYTWDVYHIENYLLESGVILSVLQRASLDEPGFDGVQSVEEALKKIAEDHIENMVEDWVRGRAHRAIRSAIRLKEGMHETDAAIKVGRKVEESAQRISHLAKTELSSEQLKLVAAERREVLKEALDDSEEWKKVFRGRDILTTFASRFAKTLGYQPLRDMIVNGMSEQGIVPPGMLRVMRAIDDA